MENGYSHCARKRRNRLAAWGLALAASLLASACSRNASDDKDTALLWKSTLTNLDNTPATLAHYQGRPLVVNFWARWCPPCRREIPDLIATSREFEAQGVSVIGIGLDDDEAAPVLEFVHDYGISYPIFLGKEQGYELMSALGNTQFALPFTVVIDREGRVVAHQIGQMSAAQMRTAFSAALR